MRRRLLALIALTPLPAAADASEDSREYLTFAYYATAQAARHWPAACGAPYADAIEAARQDLPRRHPAVYREGRDFIARSNPEAPVADFDAEILRDEREEWTKLSPAARRDRCRGAAAELKELADGIEERIRRAESAGRRAERRR